ncbi:lysylphosphatidylglycerol synthetase-like protein (DUF2156 family) [Actinoplanes octamycinicus]|uniref:Lysylphosphatidylglycerol synthetase-like protein (DUF2156 family) n=1 Tax=Actinoplanes octamycinicus TaxID=135948 RepID=A0A7W7H375_9ACTN|nr:hypothetical protein [Actinoplanes octamycinicus]MBB4743139.1 lysylphosphatidylglycerol synthetase-like protein (DUF2156 family) [Actinoplanes octamycinicus]GIE61299.1 hypothetical protein Aoc01nite_67010 [Actinoplanes octamycinicus]
MRRSLIGAGLLLFGYGVSGLLTDAPGDLLGVVVFGLVVLVLHDAVLLPLVLAGGELIRRTVPERCRTAVRSVAVSTLALTVIAVPLALGPGLRPYGKSLVLVVVVVTVTVLAGRKGIERLSAGHRRRRPG